MEKTEGPENRKRLEGLLRTSAENFSSLGFFPVLEKTEPSPATKHGKMT